MSQLLSLEVHFLVVLRNHCQIIITLRCGRDPDRPNSPIFYVLHFSISLSFPSSSGGSMSDSVLVVKLYDLEIIGEKDSIEVQSTSVELLN